MLAAGLLNCDSDSEEGASGKMSELIHVSICTRKTLEIRSRVLECDSCGEASISASTWFIKTPGFGRLPLLGHLETPDGDVNALLHITKDLGHITSDYLPLDATHSR